MSNKESKYKYITITAAFRCSLRTQTNSSSDGPKKWTFGIVEEFFCRPGVFPVAQQTASKHWRLK